VPADRVRHREERVKVAARPAPGQWRSGGPPLFRTTRGAAGARSGAPSFHDAYAIERIPVCVDCLRRQKIGLYSVCGIAAVCVLAAIVLYSQEAGPLGGQEIAVLAPAATPDASAPPKPEASPQAADGEASGPPPIWAQAALPPPAAIAPMAASTTTPVSPPPVVADAPASAPSDTQPAQSVASDSTPQGSPPVAAATNTAPARAPVWHAEHKPRPRKLATATPPTRRVTPSANALALRNNGYAAIGQRRYRDGLTMLQEATLMGDAYAPLYIGQLFENGIGVPRDVGQASYWYGIAINRGNAAALTAFNRMRVNPY
jgi:hypothetical protein